MKRILVAFMMVALVAGLVTGGVMATFSDPDTSTGNTFTAGYIDLCMSVDGSIFHNDFVWPIGTAAGMQPGVEVGPYGVWFKNCSPVTGDVHVTMNYSEADVAAQGEWVLHDVNVNKWDFARKLIVTQAYADYYNDGGWSINVAPWWAAQIIDVLYSSNMTSAINDGAVVAKSGIGGGYNCLPTMFGLSQITLGFTNGYAGADLPLTQGQIHQEKFHLMLDSSATNDYMFDGISINFVATLDQ